MNKKKLTTLFTFILTGLLSSPVWAVVPGGTAEDFPQMLFTGILITTLLVVAIVVFYLSDSIRTMMKQVAARIQQGGKTPLVLILLLLAGMSSAHAEDSPAGGALHTIAPGTGGEAHYQKYMFLAILIIVSVIIIYVVMDLSRNILSLTRMLTGEATPEKKVAAVKKESSWERFITRFNSAVPVERERDVLLDHDYDGIKELDNQLPPWWKYGFIVTIIFAFGYLTYYYVLDLGQTSAEEYTSEMQEAAAQKALNTKANAVAIDENNVVQLTDQTTLAKAAQMFSSTCATCHGDHAQGLVGPNLTDEFWLHGGGIKNVFKTITEGVPGKAMVSWKGTYNPEQIQALASYVLSLQGTKPAGGKAPEGEKYVPEQSSSTGDSTKTKGDTAKAVKSAK